MVGGGLHITAKPDIQSPLNTQWERIRTHRDRFFTRSTTLVASSADDSHVVHRVGSASSDRVNVVSLGARWCLANLVVELDLA